MAETSPIDDMSHLQSQMHFEESIESIAADSDLEDGEIKKLLTSRLYAQRASGRPDALFSPKRNEQRNQTWSSVFGNAHVSNLSETLFEDNKDHLLNRAEEKFMSSHSRSASMLYKKNGGTRQGISRRTQRICRISSRTNWIARRIVAEKESSSRYADAKYVRNEKGEESARIAS